MSRYVTVRRAIISSASLINALAQFALWIAIVLAMGNRDADAFWRCSALLALLKAGEIAEILEKRQ